MKYLKKRSNNSLLFGDGTVLRYFMPTVGLYEHLVLEKPNRKLKFIYLTY